MRTGGLLLPSHMNVSSVQICSVTHKQDTIQPQYKFPSDRFIRTSLLALIMLTRKHFRQMAAEAGRNPDDIEISVFAARPVEEELKKLTGAGVSRVTFDLPSAPSDEILPLLDKLAKMI